MVAAVNMHGVVRRGWHRLRRWRVEERLPSAFGRDEGPIVYMGWALRYPDRTTDYLESADSAELAVRELIDVTIRERRYHADPPGVPHEDGVYPARRRARRGRAAGPWTYVDLQRARGVAPLVWGTGKEGAQIRGEPAVWWEFRSRAADPVE